MNGIERSQTAALSRSQCSDYAASAKKPVLTRRVWAWSRLAAMQKKPPFQARMDVSFQRSGLIGSHLPRKSAFRPYCKNVHAAVSVTSRFHQPDDRSAGLGDLRHLTIEVGFRAPSR